MTKTHKDRAPTRTEKHSEILYQDKEDIFFEGLTQFIAAFFQRRTHFLSVGRRTILGRKKAILPESNKAFLGVDLGLFLFILFGRSGENDTHVNTFLSQKS